MAKPRRPIPEDFAYYAGIEGNLRLRKRYNARGDVIERWRRELGMPRSSRGMRRDIITKASKPVKRVILKGATRRRVAMIDERIEDLGGWDSDDALYGLPRSFSGYSE